jgi:hypothetical protein
VLIGRGRDAVDVAMVTTYGRAAAILGIQLQPDIDHYIEASETDPIQAGNWPLWLLAWLP